MKAAQIFYDTEPYWVSVSRNGSEKLLSALREHHKLSEPLPEPQSAAAATVAPIKIEIAPAAPIVLRPSCPRWFSIVDEPKPINPKVSDIKQAACKYFDVTLVDLDSARRTLELVYPRQVVMYLAKTLTGKSLPEIGRRLGGRDHTTVLHGIRKIELLVRSDWTKALDVALVEAML